MCQRKRGASLRASQRSAFSLGKRMVSKGISCGILILKLLSTTELWRSRNLLINQTVQQALKKSQMVELDVGLKKEKDVPQAR